MSIKLARRYAIHAQLEMDRCDPASIDEAIRWATMMLGALFDAKAKRDAVPNEAGKVYP
jgi:hypothetical protein